MNFELGDDQQAIKRTAREFLSQRYRPEVVRELAGEGRGFSEAQWDEVAALGWPGLAVPEEHGGLGLGAIELVVIQEELGYALAPTPLLSSVAASLLLIAAGSEAQRARWLPGLASGELRGAVAVWDEDAGWAPDGSDVRLADDGTLSATKIAVADGAGAAVLVVAGAGGEHYLVEGDAPGVAISPVPVLDPTRKLYKLVLDRVPAERLAGGDAGGAPGATAVERAYAAILTAVAAESVGVAQRAMEMAVAYAKDRKQFDRPIGAYQAVAHRCAQMLLEVEGARSLTYGAAWAIDHDPASAVRAASMAKAYAGDAAYRVSASALQVHGGIGFTWEHDLHFFLKRATANAHAFGDSRWHRERVVALAR